MTIQIDGATKRIGLALMEQIRDLEFDRLQHRHLANSRPKPLRFSIDSNEGEVQAGDAAFASAISANLRKLSADEMNVLARHGGGLVEAPHQEICTGVAWSLKASMEN